MEDTLNNSARAPDDVVLLGRVDDQRLRDLHHSRRALVYPADEDSGIVMAEAQACGAPVISIARGDALDIVSAEWLIQEQTVPALREAVARAASEDLDSAEIAASAAWFSAESFHADVRAAVREAIRASRPRPFA